MKRLICVFVTGFITAIFAQTYWIETTQEDFCDGSYERNLYASHYDGGTIEFTSRFDLNNDGFIDLLTADVEGPYVRIYWGSSSGYSSSLVTLFPTNGGSNCDAADINNDGYADFLVSHQYNQRVTVYWGTAAGPNSGYYQDFASLEPSPQGVCAADPNKDGYLDIITTHEYTPGHGAIIWGDSTGYNINNRTDLPMSWGITNIEVADLNLDGWYDILFVDYHVTAPGVIRIYWGSSTGYNPGNVALLDAPCGAHGISIAELNGDTYLDLVFQGWYDVASYVYWGSDQGYSPSNMQTLHPGYCYGGSSIEYIDDDQYLDIVYHRGGNGIAQQRIYWGSATGYSDANVTLVGVALETTGGLVADLNYDGNLDIFCNTIIPGSQSYIFWGPSFTSYQTLPVNGDHKAMFREIGNVYNRLYQEDYLSSIYDAGQETDWGVIEWDDSLPPESNVLMYVRTGTTATPDSTWSGWDSVGNGEDIPDSLMSRYIQYRARLTYGNPAYLPFLYEVRIELGPVNMIILEPDQADSTLPGQSIAYPVDVININVGDDTIDLDYAQTLSWQVGFFDSTGVIPLVDNNGNGFIDVIVDNNDTVGIIVTVMPPDTAQGGDIDSLTVIGTSTIMPSLNDTVYLITTIRSLVAILVEPDQTDSTLAGNPITYDMRVINNGTHNDTVDLFYTHNQAWGISLLDSTGTTPLTDHNSNGIPDVLVPSFDSAHICVREFPPASALPGETDTLVLTGRSSVDPAVSDNATLITIIRNLVAILVEPDQTDSTLAGNPIMYDMQVINSGTCHDTVDLFYVHNQTWSISLLDSTGTTPLIDHNSNGIPDVLVPSFDSAHICVREFPPASALPGETDTLVLTGRSSVDPAVSDDATLMTIIQGLVSLLVEPDQTGHALPGIEHRYSVWAINNGTYTDTIDLTYRHDALWPVILYQANGIDTLIDHNGNNIPDVITPSCDSTGILLSITPADSALAGETDSLILTGTSGIDTQITDSALIITIIDPAGTIIVFPDQTGNGQPDSWVHFDLACRNTQNFIDTVDLAFFDEQGWSYNLLNSLGNPLIDNNGNGMVDIPAIAPLGGEIGFAAQIFIPAGTPGSTIDSAFLFGYSGKDTTVRDSSILVITVGTYALIVMEPDQADSGTYNSTIDYFLAVQNLGNYTDTIDIAVISGSFIYSLRDKYGNLLQDTNNNGMVDIGTLAPLAQESLMVRVQVTGTQPGYIDTAIIRAYSNINNTVYDDARLYTRVAGSIWGLTIDPDQETQVEIGQTAVFYLEALLEGSIADVVDLTYDEVLGDWVITLADSNGTPLIDTDADGRVDLGTVTPSIQRRFQVLVRSPQYFDLIGQVDSLAACAFYVRGRCSLLENVTDSARLELQLVPPFDVHNFRNPFRAQTQFIFSLPKDGRVVLEIYNRVGELVRLLINNQNYSFGIHYFPWDGCNSRGERLKPGTYIYILDFTAYDGDHRIAKKKAVILE
ncbi:VCBS repeat-containing protein [candidate division WOR-3 bacterium]|nr:VCBS repeat-containing protein [candidate division WOR-3 bacterium]